MKTIKARGLVLREYEAGEADKRLLLLCKGHGRIMAYARGARKPRSKFIAAAQLFTYADFILAQGRGFHSVAQAEVIESFYALRADYDRLCAAHLLAEVCDKTLWEKSNCDGLLLLALKSLSALAKGSLPPAQVVCVFLARFFDFYGFRPQPDSCVICGVPAHEMNGGIFFGPEGLLCARHSNSMREAGENRLQGIAPAGSIPLSKPAAAALSHILNSPLARAFQFNAHPSVLRELRRAVRLFWGSHFEWELPKGAAHTH